MTPQSSALGNSSEIQKDPFRYFELIEMFACVHVHGHAHENDVSMNGILRR
jgi:hypothetical protein